MTQSKAIRLFGIPLAIMLIALIAEGQCLAAETAESTTAKQIRRLADLTQASDAVRKLQAVGPAAVPALVAALDQPDQNIQNGAMSALIEIGDPSALPALSKIALSDDPRFDIARRGVARIGGPDAATCLIGLLNRHVMGDVARNIAHDLAAIGDNRAVEPLSQLLRGQLIGRRNDQDAYSDMEKVWAREAAAQALGHFRDPRARAALKQAIAEDPDWDVYFAAKEALRQFDQPTEYVFQRDLIPLAVEKQPEPPEGAEAFVRKWQLDNDPKFTAWTGPSVLDYADAKEITRARAQLLREAQYPPVAFELVETLMAYLRNKKYTYGPGEARALIVQIGAPAVPALEIGEKRGDITLMKCCRECIDAIRAQAATLPKQ